MKKANSQKVECNQQGTPADHVVAGFFGKETPWAAKAKCADIGLSLRFMVTTEQKPPLGVPKYVQQKVRSRIICASLPWVPVF